MSRSTSVKIKSSLSQKMSVPGGLAIADALIRGEKALEGHREAGMVTMAGLLANLEAVVEAKAANSTSDVYCIAAELLDMAGFFETGPLYKATFSLCEITDRMQTAGTWDWPSVAVHVRSMRMIVADGCRDSENSRTILMGLTAVSQRYG